MMIWMWTALVALVGYVLYRVVDADSKRKELTRKLRVLLVQVGQAEASFDAYTSPAAGYFDHYKKETWKNQHRQLFGLATDLPYNATTPTPRRNTGSLTIALRLLFAVFLWYQETIAAIATILTLQGIAHPLFYFFRGPKVKAGGLYQYNVPIETTVT